MNERGTSTAVYKSKPYVVDTFLSPYDVRVVPQTKYQYSATVLAIQASVSVSESSLISGRCDPLNMNWVEQVLSHHTDIPSTQRHSDLKKRHQIAEKRHQTFVLYLGEFSCQRE
ncbi:MAG: hypothetical protein R3A44_00190 [Caldilineaceae bacterium]